MAARWRLKQTEPELVKSLSQQSGLPTLVAQLLVNRGVRTASEARAFLDVRRDGLHDPETLPGVVEAAERVAQAIRDDRKIIIYGDYDVDGVCGTSLLLSCLRLAGAVNVECYIPHRVDEGYGLNPEALRMLASERGASLVITVDCGVSALEEARLARTLGIELVITDHHTPGREWPEADAVVHPRAPGSTYPFGDLCGAGVAFKLAWQVCKSFGDGKRASPHLRKFLVESMNLVALATVADVVPLEGENRIFVKHGLRGLVQDASVGLKALMEVSGCLGRAKLSTGSIGFGMAPRINAAGRLERAMIAVELLTTEDAGLALELARGLDECNSRRQEVERQMVDEAHAMIHQQGGLQDRGAIVLGKPGWHPGVIGIVAGRLAETYHRPTIIVALNEVGQGSARSVAGFDLYQAISLCSDGLLSFGGHTAAAGLKLDPAFFPEFARRFEDHCREALAPELRQKTIWLDAEVRLGELSMKTVEAIENLEPYGMGNPRPTLVADQVQVVGEPRMVGERKNHVQLRLSQGGVVHKAIGFNMASRVTDLKAGSVISVVFEPEINEWNHRRDVQLHIKDLRLATEPAQAQPV